MVVADECHYIKHINSKRAQATLPFIMQCDHALMLSGTPCLTTRRTFACLHALRPSIVSSSNGLPNDTAMQEKQNSAALTQPGTTQSGAVLKLRRAFMIRKTKSDVRLELPKKHQMQVHVKSKDIKTLNEIAALFEKIEESQPLAEALISETFRKTCRAKLEVVSSFCAGMQKNTHNYFCASQRILDALQSAGEKELNCLRIDGDTSQEKTRNG